MAQTYKFGNGTWARKKGSTLAYSDTNNAFKPLPFNFTRDSIATRVNKEGLIEVVGNDIPRIDYTDSTEGALLLENSSTNLITQSEDFSNASWTKVQASVTSGFTSPNGDTNAFKLVENTNNAAHITFASPTVTLGNNTFSVFAKASERRVLGIEFPTNGILVSFDLIDGIFVNSQANPDGFSITPYENGWYRIDIQENLTSTSTLSLSLRDDNGNRTYQGDGTSGLYIWGAMLEANSVASSYIPTNGSTVQRAAETCSGSGNSEVFNDSQGVVFANISGLDTQSTAKSITINQSSTNILGFYYYQSRIDAYVKVGTNQFFKTHYLDPTANVKISLKYKQNDFALWINGF